MLGQAAVVGVEVLVVPLVGTVVGVLLLVVVPVVVGEHLEAVVATVVDVGGEVEAEGHDAVLAHAYAVAVEPHGGRLAGSLKLDEHLLALGLAWQTEGLGVAHRVVGEVVDGYAVGIVFVERTGQGGHVGGAFIGVVPVGVEVVLAALGMEGEAAQQCNSCQ